MSIEPYIGALLETSTRGFAERHRADFDRTITTANPEGARELLEEMAALGWLTALTDPEDPTSLDDEPMLLATIVQELGRVSPAYAGRLLAHHFCRTCIRGGDPEHQLDDLSARDDWIGLEAGVGDPRFAPTLRIVRRESALFLNGSMRFVIGGDHARRWFGTAQLAEGAYGLVLVEPSAALEVTPVRTLGLHGLGGIDANFVDVTEEDFHVVATGEEVAPRIAQANQCVCLGYLGLTLSLLEQTQRIAVDHAHTRRQNGTYLREIPAISLHLGCIDRAIGLLRLAVHAYPTDPYATVGALADIKSAALRAADAGLQTLGGAGYIVGHGVERHWRDTLQLGELFLRNPW